MKFKYQVSLWAREIDTAEYFKIGQWLKQHVGPRYQVWDVAWCRPPLLPDSFCFKHRCDAVLFELTHG